MKTLLWSISFCPTIVEALFLNLSLLGRENCISSYAVKGRRPQSKVLREANVVNDIYQQQFIVFSSFIATTKSEFNLYFSSTGKSVNLTVSCCDVVMSRRIAVPAFTSSSPMMTARAIFRLFACRICAFKLLAEVAEITPIP